MCTIFRFKRHLFIPYNLWGSIISRSSNTLFGGVLESHRKSVLSKDKEEEDLPVSVPRDYKYVYPEFLPDPSWKKRDKVREKLERQDMIHRRTILDIPEFYVGSILAVTVSDPYAHGKQNRFVGICIQRGGTGLRSHLTLRNVVDGQGVEIMYELYNPLLLKIEVLKLEKRLDEELYYLRDSGPEHSTVPFDMEAIPHPPGAQVPVNQVKVQLGSRPWHERWERKDLKGVEPLELPEKFFKRARELAQPWEKYDLMKQYRSSINEDETREIMDEIYPQMTKIESTHGKKRLAATVKRKS